MKVPKTRRHAISYKDLPSRSPLIVTLVSYLMLDRLSAPGWIWGALGLFLVAMWVGYILYLFTCESHRLDFEKCAKEGED
jgi:hypothetical protein